MKIKADFVTNSSSTAYVVFVPNEFYPDEDEIKALYNNEFSLYQTATDEQLYKELPDSVESLKEGSNVWYYGGDGLNSTVWNIILEICRQRGFVLAEMEMNGEGNNIMQGVPEETIEKIMTNNIDMFSMFNMIQRSKNVTAKTE